MDEFLTEKDIQKIKNMYQPGIRVKLLQMDDPQAPHNDKDFHSCEEELGIIIGDYNITPDRVNGLFCIDQKNMELNDDLAEGNVELNLEKDGSISLEYFNVQNEVSLSSFFDYYDFSDADQNFIDASITDFRAKKSTLETLMEKLKLCGIGLCDVQSFILPDEGDLLVSHENSDSVNNSATSNRAWKHFAL